MTHQIDIEIACGQTEIDAELVREVVMATLDRYGEPDSEVSVLLTGDARVQDLNRQYRGVDAPTDVLSFALRESRGPDDPAATVHVPLGDVVISLQRAQAQSREYGHDIRRELAWLLVHGVLQLLGYRHDTAESQTEMRTAEEEVLSSLELRRPE